MPTGSTLLSYPAIARSALGLVARPVTHAAARDLIRRRLERRVERFLETARAFIYENPQSPYLPLLGFAGCEYGDLERMVRGQGLEPTLDALRHAGVYLSFEEFKGRAEVVRGPRTLRFMESQFDNPRHGTMGEMRTSGTRSQGSRIPFRLDHLAEQRAPVLWMMLEALAVAGAPVVQWQLGVLAGAGFSTWLSLAKMRQPPVHWYSLQDPDGPDVSARHRAFVRTLRWMGRAAGMRLPFPVFTPVDQVDRVVDGITALLVRHGRCALLTTASAAVRLAAAASASGRSLRGLSIITAGEPLTDGKHAEIAASGARAGSHYVLSEAGSVGAACGAPQAADDVHLLTDCFAMIRHRREWPLIGQADAFMLTTLARSARKVLLNVEIDDLGIVTERRCGCPLGELGLHTHLSGIRSFTKLTGEGTTVFGTDCLRALEEVLPREFGGRSIDYQVLEREGADHVTRLYLVVSPSVGKIDEARALARFKEEVLGQRARATHIWRQAETIQLVRQEPLATAGGKLLPFHTLAVGSPRARAG